MVFVLWTMTILNNQKRKREAISLAGKQLIIEASEARQPLSWSRILTISMASWRIQNIINNKDKILKAIDEGGNGKRARLRSVKHIGLEEGSTSEIGGSKREYSRRQPCSIRNKSRNLPKQSSLSYACQRAETDFNYPSSYSHKFVFLLLRCRYERSSIMLVYSDWFQTENYHAVRVSRLGF